jgi:hypothetical protein
MKVQYGTVITGASGSLGGIVAARNANGAYLRRKVKNVNRNTIPQQIRRNQFGALSRYWKTLPSDAQNSWVQGVTAFPYRNKLNIASTYSGQQLYSKFNNQLIAIGEPQIDYCPIGVSFDSIEVINAQLNLMANTFLVNVKDTTNNEFAVPPGFTLVIFATKPLSQGILAPKKPMFRFIQKVAAEASSASINIFSAYVAIFGTPNTATANTYVQAFLVSNTSGQTGKPVQVLGTTV